jgi:hypothetical protein
MKFVIFVLFFIKGSIVPLHCRVVEVDSATLVITKVTFNTLVKILLEFTICYDINEF